MEDEVWRSRLTGGPAGPRIVAVLLEAEPLGEGISDDAECDGTFNRKERTSSDEQPRERVEFRFEKFDPYTILGLDSSFLYVHEESSKQSDADARTESLD